MNPEPLTKEKMWFCKKCAYFTKRKEEKCPMCGGELVQEEVEFKKLSEIIQPTFEDFIKQRVNWLLKEIEKEIENTNRILNKKDCVGSCRFFQAGFRDGLQFAQRKIKKAFEGVVRE